MPAAAVADASTPTYSIGGTSYGNVGAAFSAVDDVLGEIRRIDGVGAAQLFAAGRAMRPAHLAIVVV